MAGGLSKTGFLPINMWIVVSAVIIYRYYAGFPSPTGGFDSRLPLMAKKNQLPVARAFTAFSKKFSRSFQATDNSKPNIVHEDEILQKKIDAKEAEYRASIISKYQAYSDPYHTYGKKSPEAAAIAEDEANLVKAYSLFKAVREANLSIGDLSTFITVKKVESPLTSRECYTIGKNFIYLQCWLIYEQGARDFIPEIVEIEENMETRYELQFSPLKNYNFDYKDKEVIAIIESVYHPSQKKS